MTLPNFIVAGFPKCGSTALHYLLEEHPEIFMPKQKELHFFTNSILSKLSKGPNDIETKRTQIRSLNKYKKCYKGVNGEKAIGDASPSYINYPEVFMDIKQSLNNPKVIILVRDPIKRAYSNYLHLVREQRENLDFSEALKMEGKRKELKYSDFWYYTFNSLYYLKIKEAMDCFENVLIITQEELNSSTRETLKRVFIFLGVDEHFIPANLNRKYNPGGSYKSNALTNFIFKKNKVNTWIRVLIPIPAWVKHIKHKVLKKYQTATPSIKEEVEDHLVELFKSDVISLKGLGVDTSKWNKKYFSGN